MISTHSCWQNRVGMQLIIRRLNDLQAFNQRKRIDCYIAQICHLQTIKGCSSRLNIIWSYHRAFLANLLRPKAGSTSPAGPNIHRDTHKTYIQAFRVCGLRQSHKSLRATEAGQIISRNWLIGHEVHPLFSNL